jgi:mRNA-degrading endonuclease RelE of RelBE toxin-antitoxin system
MKSIVLLPSFDRCFKKLDPQAKNRVTDAIKAFDKFLLSGDLTKGPGFKKINHDKYEFRVDIHLRVAMKIDQNVCYLVLVGSHDDIRKYLKAYR